MIVGVFAAAPYTQEIIAVEPGSMLYIFSGGCYEMPLIGGDTMEAAPFLTMLESCAQAMQSLDSVVRQMQDIQGKPEFDYDFSLLEFRFF